MPETACLHIQAREDDPVRVVTLPGDSVRIGRASYCEVRLPEPGVADEECQLRRRGRTWHLVPVGRPGDRRDRRPRRSRSPAAPVRRPFRVGDHRSDAPSSAAPGRRAPAARLDDSRGGPGPASATSRPTARGDAGASADDRPPGRPARSSARAGARTRQEERRWEERWKAAGERIRSRAPGGRPLRSRPPPRRPAAPAPTSATRRPPGPAPDGRVSRPPRRGSRDLRSVDPSSPGRRPPRVVPLGVAPPRAPRRPR